MNQPRDIQAYAEAEKLLQNLVNLHQHKIGSAYFAQYQRLLLQLVECANGLGNYAFKYFCFHMQDNLTGIRRHAFAKDSTQFALFSQWPQMQLRYLQDNDTSSSFVVEVLEFLRNEDWYYPLEKKDSDWLLNIVLNPYDREVLKSSISNRNSVAQQESGDSVMTSSINHAGEVDNLPLPVVDDVEVLQAPEEIALGQVEGSTSDDGMHTSTLSADPLLAALNDSVPNDDSVRDDLSAKTTSSHVSGAADCCTNYNATVENNLQQTLQAEDADHELHAIESKGSEETLFSADTEDNALYMVSSNNADEHAVPNAGGLDALLGSQGVAEDQSVAENEFDILFSSSCESEQSDNAAMESEEQPSIEQGLMIDEMATEATVNNLLDSVAGDSEGVEVSEEVAENLDALLMSSGQEEKELRTGEKLDEENLTAESVVLNKREITEENNSHEDPSSSEITAEMQSIIGDESLAMVQSDDASSLEALFTSHGKAEDEPPTMEMPVDPFTALANSEQPSEVYTNQENNTPGEFQQMFAASSLEESLIATNVAEDEPSPAISDAAAIDAGTENHDDVDSLLGSQSEIADEAEVEQQTVHADTASREVGVDQSADVEEPVLTQVLEDDSANELLSLITMEVQQLAVQVEKWALHEGDIASQLSKDQIHDYSEELNRIGAASEMIGMQAMHTVCVHVEENLNHWADNYPVDLAKLGDALPGVLRLIENYLGSKDKSHSYQKLVDYIKSEFWPCQFAVDETDALCEQFDNFVIEIEQTPVESTPRHAQLEDLSIAVPEDVNAAVLDGMLQELPGQMETLSAAVIALRDESFMHNLEVAKRTAHTLKGAANTVGIKGIANITHTMEDVFEALFRASRKPTEAMYQSLVDTADLLEQMTECLLGYGDEINDALGRYQLLLDWACDIDQLGMPSEETDLPVEKVHEQQPVEKQQEAKQPVKEKKEAAAPGRSTDAIIDELLDFSGEQIILTTQMQDKVSASNQLLRSLKKGNQRIQELTDEFEHLVEIKNIAARSSYSLQNGEFDPLEVDQFNELRTFGRRLMEACADNAEIMDALANRVHAITDDCTQNLQLHTYSQKRLIQSSMVTVSTLLPRLKRALRQANNATGKSAQLEIVGEHTLIDRRMMGVLGDSLLHLVRNAVDHGIEHADLRTASGKTESGTVKLEFIAYEDQVLVRCSDDGAGLSVRNIAAKAKRLGLIDEDEELDQEQAIAMILQHGFSTRDEATQLSGRGVGLDNVHSGLLEVNGTMRVTSQPGEGTQIEMHFPANLLYAQVLLVESGGEVFAVSTRGLEEILPASAGSVRETAGVFEFDTGDEHHALHSLAQLLEYAAEPNLSSNSMLLNLRGVDDRVRLVSVDSILRSTEAVIKPLSRYLPRVQGVIGSTVLGDGRLVTVLDLQGLMIRYSEVGQRSIQDIHANIPVAPSKRILIVEDSVSTRRALEELSRDLGYETRSAIDGVDATALLQEYQPDVLITDLEMPRMNGFELVSHVRSNPTLSSTPVIMLTSRSTEKHRNEATRVGVDEYLTKPFSEEQLQQVIEQLLNQNQPAEPVSSAG